MKELSTKQFEREYFTIGRDPETKKEVNKLKDYFQTHPTTKWLPFTQNTSASFYDRSCGILGITGDFCRRKSKKAITPIYNKEDALKMLDEKLRIKYRMEDREIDLFKDIFSDILFESNTLNVIDPSFFIFAPLKYTEDKIKGEKYVSGQKKIANYCLSLYGDIDEQNNINKQDLFSEIVYGCLEDEHPDKTKDTNQSYYVLPFIKDQFKSDYNWLMNQPNQAIIKNLPIFLHFYTCYSILQFLLYLNRNNWNIQPVKPIDIYYILVNEHATRSSDAVVKGWSASNRLPDTLIDKLTAYTQVLDILNSLFENESLMTFNEIIKKFESISFNQHAKYTCEYILDEYQRRKRTTLLTRPSNKPALPKEINISVSSFDDFINKLFELCTSLAVKDHANKFRRAIYELFKVRLFSKRREHKVLVLDDDILMLLIALVSRGERIRIDELFNKLRDNYGIALSFETKNQIVDNLVKLNLVDRKSDSGEAQYVQFVL